MNSEPDSSRIVFYGPDLAGAMESAFVSKADMPSDIESVAGGYLATCPIVLNIASPVRSDGDEMLAEWAFSENGIDFATRMLGPQCCESMNEIDVSEVGAVAVSSGEE